MILKSGAELLEKNIKLALKTDICIAANGYFLTKVVNFKNKCNDPAINFSRIRFLNFYFLEHLKFL